MTLTLEQVRQTRFHLARRNGYEPVDVDSFVDKVEATLSQLVEENSTLKQQVDTLSSAEPTGIFAGAPGADDGEKAALREELPHTQAPVGELRSPIADECFCLLMFQGASPLATNRGRYAANTNCTPRERRHQLNNCLIGSASTNRIGRSHGPGIMVVSRLIPMP